MNLSCENPGALDESHDLLQFKMNICWHKSGLWTKEVQLWLLHWKLSAANRKCNVSMICLVFFGSFHAYHPNFKCLCLRTITLLEQEHCRVVLYWRITRIQSYFHISWGFVCLFFNMMARLLRCDISVDSITVQVLSPSPKWWD